ncbi:MAG: ABC transporter permease [Alphaproteobacteria bacterium]
MFWTTLALAWREITHNPMRSGLTTLGIVIGVAAVIVMVTLGNGATQRVTNDIAGLGTNLVYLQPGTGRRNGPPLPANSFDEEDVEAIGRDIKGISHLSAMIARSGAAIYADKSHATIVLGTDNEFFPTRNYEVGAGRMFTTAELRSGRAVCILGETVRTELFGRETPLGATIRLGNSLACEVIGLLTPKGAVGLGSDQDDLIVAPLAMVQRRMAGNRNVDYIFLSVADEARSAEVQDRLKLLMRERRHVRAGTPDDFVVSDMKQVTELLTTVTGILTAVLSAIAAISLLVGGIGIMNIMLVSVTERTREIGIRLAVGALERDVLFQFLIEAVALSILGGLMGVALGLGGAALAAFFLKLPFVPSPGVILFALVFSGVVGTIFGFFPARRAARLDPIDALRYE